MSVIKNNYSVSPSFIGTCRYISKDRKVVYGSGFKEIAQVAWSVIKPVIRSALTNPAVQNAAAEGASKIAELLGNKQSNIGSFLTNPTVRDYASQGASKLAELLDDKPVGKSKNVSTKGNLANDVINGKKGKKGKGLSQEGRSKLNMLLGRGIKYLY